MEKTLKRILKRLVFASEEIQGLLIDGMTDTQNEFWEDELEKFFEALEQAKEILDLGDKPQ